MNIEDLPDLAPPDLGGVEDPSRPIVSFAWRADQPHRAAAHRHPRAHIIEVLEGSLWSATPDGCWLIPTNQAIWIPPRIFHRVYSHGPVSARMVFVDESSATALPTRSGTVAVSVLLSELMARAVDHGNDYPAHSPMFRLSAVLLDELATMAVAPLLIPMARDPRLADVMNQLTADPGCDDSLASIAARSGASSRTIARLFSAEVGMTFTQWRSRVRLITSIERLNNGATVTQVATELGYSSSAAFTHMFRSSLGQLPSSYQHNRPKTNRSAG
ncbi:MAG: helix-turn-helix domain-containing protein [Acidimicrobiia bacterium]